MSPGNLVRKMLDLVPKPVRRLRKYFTLPGQERFCPVCGKTARGFQRAGVKSRSNARCPNCGSLERHRLFWRFLEERTNFFQSSGKRMLHVAAEPCFEPRFRKQVGSGYLTSDLFLPADVKMDVTDIQYPDDSFDIVYCSHVLEHVPDDRKAMREFHRVVRPSGWAIVLVPVFAERTIEDPSITDPQERIRLFGQQDHVRRYGPDYADRLCEAGFAVEEFKAADFLNPAEMERIAVATPAAGSIYFCQKEARRSPAQ